MATPTDSRVGIIIIIIIIDTFIKRHKCLGYRGLCFMREFILAACIITPKNFVKFYWVTSVGTPTTNELGKNVR